MRVRSSLDTAHIRQKQNRGKLTKPRKGKIPRNKRAKGLEEKIT
jgi:hypothetical protein